MTICGASGDVLTKFISGLKDCHLPGLHSYVLQDRMNDANGMIRIFHNTGKAMATLTDADGSFRLAPHNHRQDIALFRIFGFAMNVNFSFDARLSGHYGYEYVFDSQLVDGKMGVHFHALGDLDITDIAPITTAGISLPATQVHTVVAEPDSAWLVMEGKTANDVSLCYSKKNDFTLNSEGLYTPLDEAALALAWEYIFPCA